MGKRGTRQEARTSREGVSKSKIFGTEQEAQNWVRQTSAALACGEYSPKTAAYTMTLHQAIADYSIEFAANKAWPKVEQNRVKRLKREAFTNKALSEVSSKDIRDFGEARPKRASVGMRSG